jgi:DNA polymerase-3 subunit epsilon
LAKATLYAIIDIETTGTDPRRDGITEIAIILTDGKELIDSYTTLINPEKAIPWDITRITGIDNDMVKDAPKFYEVAKKIVELTEGAVFVAHNVRFDYGFIQHAFRRLGYTYSRKQLCTVRLSRKLMPGFKSYSLGALCKRLKINNDAAHRAWGDAEATFQLFKMLINDELDDDIPLTLKAEIAANKLPPNLPPEVLDALPNTVGVYYFYDKKGNLLYIGKSNGIRKRVLSHFSAAHKSSRKMRMIQSMADISYVETGNELIALLHENEEIKRHLPPYNRAQRRTRLKYGIFTDTNKEGYITFSIHSLPERKDPLSPYAERGQAEGALKRRAEEFELCLGLCGINSCRHSTCMYQQLKLCTGAGVGLESTEVYNERAEAAIQHLKYGEASFLIISPGRRDEERSAVWIENGIYRGFGYFEPQFVDDEGIFECIEYRDETPDVRRIIQGYIRRFPKEVRILGSP